MRAWSVNPKVTDLTCPSQEAVMTREVIAVVVHYMLTAIQEEK